ncbi:MAG: hypothetical protein EP347_06835 [Alphaproteobacteria bacterium]|nr:MAG: hypothetical protein EP347_06835 [Alphaproteobacteria bacterium]
MNEAYLEILAQLKKTWRWRWIGIPVVWVFAVIGTTFVVLMPDQYESKAVIQVDPNTTLDQATKGVTVEANVQRQLQTKTETLLSMPNLQQVARSVDLDLEITNEAEEQEMLESLKSRIKVRLTKFNVLEVSFVDTDPKRARDVVQALLTVFTESNLGQNRTSIQSSESFLKTQIADYEARLSEAEQRMAKFRAEHLGILSGEKTFVERMRAAAQAVKEIDFQIAETTAVRDQLEANLRKTPKYNTMESAPPILIDGQLVSSTYSQIQAERKRLDDLLAQYTENHPDVVASQKRLTRLIDRYEREREGKSGDNEEENFVNATKVANPVHEQLSLKLLDANQQLSILEQKKKTAQEVYEEMQKNATKAPEIEAQMQALNRDYNVIKASYENILAGRERVKLTSERNAWTDAVQYQNVEPPVIPALPSGPPRLIYLGMVLVFAFGAGGGTSFLRAQLEDTFAVASRLNQTFGLPVIGSISRIESLSSKAKSALSNTTFLIAAAMPVGLVVIAALLLPYMDGLRDAINITGLSG